MFKWRLNIWFISLLHRRKQKVECRGWKRLSRPIEINIGSVARGFLIAIVP